MAPRVGAPYQGGRAWVQLTSFILIASPFLFDVSLAQTVGSIVTSSLYDSIFPHRNTFYTYNSFIAAAGSFPTFGTKTQNIAAFFAHVTHGTSGLRYINEIDQSGNYCNATDTEYPCASGQQYYGRGPLQISYNYNYGACGKAIGKDLLNNPGLVASDPTVSWKTAFWFWVTPQAPKPSCVSVMDGTWSPSAADTAAGRKPGFGLTIDIINGGIECGPNAQNPKEASDRVTQYQDICGTFGVAVGNNLDCTTMKPYG